MKATIQKWGNSLALRLPKALAEGAAIREGAEVDLIPTKEGLLLKPKRAPRYCLSDLVAGITAENIHSETDWGRSLEREILE